MPSRDSRFWITAFFLTLGLATAIAQSPARTNNSSSATTRPSSAKGPLPDPVLLDGSAMEPEKRPDHGMLGEFEMPGDENAKGDKVGQTSDKQPAGGGGGAPQDPKNQNQMGKMGGGGGAPSDKSPPAQSQSAGGGAASSNNNQPPGGAGNPGGANDPNAKAEGMQVGELKGSGGTGQNAAAASKPSQIALGDSAMQIKPQSDAPGMVGTQNQLPQGKDVPQQYDAKTPGGGKQSGGHGNQGVEKGRVMPSGI